MAAAAPAVDAGALRMPSGAVRGVVCMAAALMLSTRHTHGNATHARAPI